jgi:cyclin-dependent kinase regulatory subunit CKS1
MPRFPDDIIYSEKYADNQFEYRHVILPKEKYKSMPKKRLLLEQEWRALGVKGSPGWVHYDIYNPEPHVLLLRKPLS